MRQFLTEYMQDGTKFGSHVFARSYKGAEKICIARNIGEKVLGVLPEPDLDVNPSENPMQSLHEACFLSYLALKAGTLSIDEVLGDKGILHEMTHVLHFSETKVDPAVFEAPLAVLRKAVPGYML